MRSARTQRLHQRAKELAVQTVGLRQRSTELGQVAEATLDRAILACTWSRERRRRRDVRLAWCARCGEPVTADDVALLAKFVRAGDMVAGDPVTLHQTCLGAWIIGRVRPSD